MRTAIIATILCVATTTATAGVYRCERNGKTVFSDKPCGTAAEEIEVETYTPSAEDAAHTKARRQETAEYLEAKEKERERTQLRRKIASLRGDIKGYEANMDAELAALRNKKKRANNNLAGATWEGSISEEMKAVTLRYQSKIDNARERIRGLEKRLEDL